MADSANDHALDSILKPLCDPDRPHIADPFGMDFEGRRWAVASNGLVLVAIAGDYPLRATAPDATQIVGKEPPPVHRVSVAALKEWAGPVPPPPAPPSTEKKTVKCDECNGQGTTTCPTCDSDDYECEGCDGTGEQEEDVDTTPTIEPRYGALLSGFLNRHLLARVLATVPGDVTEILIGQREELSPYILRAPDWIGAVMPCRDVEVTERFEMPVAA